MAQKSKFFRVAVEGATTDGRTIDRTWIEQMARNFDPQKYGARVWLEHIRGIYPDSDFRAYGDVSAVKAEEITLDGKNKLALFAQIEPLPDLVAMTKSKQKIYTSIEINPKFADSGEAYLVGLGVTDSPASLGTEVLSFAAKHPQANPFAARKHDPENLFSEAVEIALEFEEAADDEPSVATAAIKGMKDAVARFTGRFKRQDGDVAELAGAIGTMTDAIGSLAEQRAGDAKAFAKLSADFAAGQKTLAALEAQFKSIDTTDPALHSRRPPATGGHPQLQKTDC